MINEQDIKKINELSWYQTIQFTPEVKSQGCAWCGDPAWNNIKKFLPEDLSGKRILDLGCNAGIFCVRSILKGAHECVGIENDSWKAGSGFYEQALFVKDVFERLYGNQFNIQYKKVDMCDFVYDESAGHFDYVLAIASIYYAKDLIRVIRGLSKISDRVILRLRDEDRIENATKAMMDNNGFKLEGMLRERWWETLKCQTDDFYLFYYVKQ